MPINKKTSACGVNKVCGYPNSYCDYFESCNCCSCKTLPLEYKSVCRFLDESCTVYCENEKAWPEGEDMKVSMEIDNGHLDRTESFRVLVKPVMEWIKSNYDPHTRVVIDCTVYIDSLPAEVLSGEMSVYDKDSDVE
jgi:hypothetical protein